MLFLFYVKQRAFLDIMNIDLHCHSHFSDGILSPRALLDKALAAHVQLLALTDHDTVDGVRLLQEAAQGHDITILEGIEVSVRWKKYDIHVLGLGIEKDNPILQASLLQQTENRILRARHIAERLESAGITHAYQKACDKAGHERVGRVHFAQVLIDEGRARDIKKAFQHFLGQGRMAYVATSWLSLEEAITAITASGGLAVIAHPLKYRLTRSKLHELINAFKEVGGVGMEVVSGSTTIAEANELAGLCQRFELFASSGSDYHGDDLSHTKVGQQRPLPVNCRPIWSQWTF